MACSPESVEDFGKVISLDETNDRRFGHIKLVESYVAFLNGMLVLEEPDKTLEPRDSQLEAHHRRKYGEKG